jgi:DNA/RNA endonuclease G (NUC1)
MKHALRQRANAFVFGAATLLLGACTDGPLSNPHIPAPEAPAAPAAPGAGFALACAADVRALSVRCETPAASAGGASAAIIGGQRTFVTLRSSDLAYTAADSVFAFNVTVENLLNEALGTVDGVTRHADRIRVLVADGPTVTEGTGTITVANADGTDDFTASAQPYFRYDTVLAKNQESAPRRWEFKVPSTATAFGFVVYVAAETQRHLLITELMANPGGSVQDSTGEYVEVYNRGTLSTNLNGFVIGDNSAGVRDTIKTDLVIPPGGYAVLGRSQNTSKNGGVTVNYVYTSRIGTTATTLTFSNSGADFFRIQSPNGVTVDSAGYASAGASTVAKAGIARELQGLNPDNVDVAGVNWGDASNVYDSFNNNRGTPGFANGTAVPPGPATFVSVSPTFAQLAPGQTRQYSAQAYDANNVPVTTTFTWSSEDTTVARINPSTGLATAVADGETRIFATSANGISNWRNIQVFTAAASAVIRNHLEFGTPGDGTPANDILLNKQWFSLSYSEVRGGPNWVSWNVNRTHFGGASRCDCFSPDATLPAGVYQVVTGDYTGSGYTRGHMVRSEERTQTPADNAQTFLMTNILPQLSDLNAGPWGQLEFHVEALAKFDNKELYIIAGGIYPASPATLNNAGKVQIPSHTWKIIVVMDSGEGLANVASAADIQVIAVNMPNITGISSQPWTAYTTTVDALEAATGYDFLSALPDAIETAVEGS